VCRVIPYRGFESRLLRQDIKAFKFNDLKAFFIYFCNSNRHSFAHLPTR
jgi:hypothetical protein